MRAIRLRSRTGGMSSSRKPIPSHRKIFYEPRTITKWTQGDQPWYFRPVPPVRGSKAPTSRADCSRPGATTTNCTRRTTSSFSASNYRGSTRGDRRLVGRRHPQHRRRTRGRSARRAEDLSPSVPLPEERRGRRHHRAVYQRDPRSPASGDGRCDHPREGDRDPDLTFPRARRLIPSGSSRPILS